MKPTSFKQTNKVFSKPPDMTDEECDQLAVYQDANQIISCWKLSDEKMEILIRTKKVWVYHSGNYLQPHALAVENPFEPTI